ncbi:uncharacterized protein LOC111070830 [Drosophila obscura]|uniref:uncharacterized protein LOC111070830 n=1 Tax=Drosophila obscura TaxID=7282 RepID=UPI000BA155D7|nr:uncharacterized protein LOC111070830 [Drosophila obscura]
MAAIRLRDSDQWMSQHTGHATILNGNVIVPTKTDNWLEGPPGPDGAIQIFTDGSKLDNKVGGGIYSEQLNIRHSFRLPDHSSVFQAEFIAINEALGWLCEIATTASHLNIYVDSLFA